MDEQFIKAMLAAAAEAIPGATQVQRQALVLRALDVARTLQAILRQGLTQAHTIGGSDDARAEAAAGTLAVRFIATWLGMGSEDRDGTAGLTKLAKAWADLVGPTEPPPPVGRLVH